MERLLNAKLHGCPGACPACGKPKVELIFDEAETNLLVRVECRHMKGAGRRCKWSTDITAENKAQLLQFGLQDSPDGYLTSVGIATSVAQ